MLKVAIKLVAAYARITGARGLFGTEFVTAHVSVQVFSAKSRQELSVERVGGVFSIRLRKHLLPALP